MLLDEHHECELVAGPKAFDELEVLPGGDDAGGAHDVKGTTVRRGASVTYNAEMGDDREPISLAIDIGGTFTDLAAVDRNAPFHPRCPYAIDRCRTDVPELRVIDGRTVACHRAEEIVGGDLQD